jgi:hypothetical protein
MDQIGKDFGWVLLSAGPCALVESLFSVVRAMRRSAEANGKVIRLEQSMDRVGARSYESYAPVFSFCSGGKTYTVTSKISSSPADFVVGDSVKVRYDPANPENARIHTFYRTCGIGIIFGVVGAGFITFGLYFLGILRFK